MSADTPVPPPRLLVLDVNETLSDTAPLREVFVEIGLEAHEAEPWFAGVLRDGFALSVVGENPDFAELAREGVRVRLGRDDADAVDRVLASFRDLPVHPDVVPGLRAIAGAGVRLVTLSNGASAVARTLLENAAVAELFEHFLSVADAPAWKPDPRAYAHALDVTGVTADEAMLVAVHPWDVDGAARAGLRTAWVNRTIGAYPAYATTPEVVASELTDLARQIGAG